MSDVDPFVCAISFKIGILTSGREGIEEKHKKEEMSNEIYRH